MLFARKMLEQLVRVDANCAQMTEASFQLFLRIQPTPELFKQLGRELFCFQLVLPASFSIFSSRQFSAEMFLPRRFPFFTFLHANFNF